MPFIDHQGGRTHFLQLSGELGSDSEDLIMVHGLGTSLSYWYSPHAVSFSKRFRVTLYDLPGHGRSSMPASGYSPTALIMGLQHLMDSIGIERAHLVAHSFGGVIALGAACLQPERIADIILADTQISAFRGLEEERPGEAGVALQEELGLHGIELDIRDPYFGFRLLGAVARLQMRPDGASPELTRLLGPLLGRNSRRAAQKWLQLLETTRAEQELMADDGLTSGHLRQLDLPVLGMYGERSRCLPAGKKLNEHLPRCRFLLVPGAGHFFPSTQSSVFMYQCKRFWEECHTVRRTT